MDFDHIVIGSGLSALAVVAGLGETSRILVLQGGQAGKTAHYENAPAVPASHGGAGGLGNFWHGVIPAGKSAAPRGATDSEFVALFDQFHPGTKIREKLGEPLLFVPRSPIRPALEWEKMNARRALPVAFLPLDANQISLSDGHVTIADSNGSHKARTVWLCAGALGTPRLAQASFGPGLARKTADDHVISYLGLVSGSAARADIAPRVERENGGMWLPYHLREASQSLMTFRPARFDFAELDRGFEKRAIFGLPAKTIIGRLLKRPSAGLIAEALFNKFGLFPNAASHSAYAQTLVKNAYALNLETGTLSANHKQIRAATDLARELAAIDGLQPSRRPDLFLPGIHLHNTIDAAAAEAAGLGGPHSPVQFADASVLADIGPEHHSFKMMVAAFAKAKAFA